MFTHNFKYSKSLNVLVIELIPNQAYFDELGFFYKPIIYFTKLNNEFIIKFDFDFPIEVNGTELKKIESMITYVSNNIGKYWKLRFNPTTNAHFLYTTTIYFKPYREILLQLI